MYTFTYICYYLHLPTVYLPISVIPATSATYTVSVIAIRSFTVTFLHDHQATLTVHVQDV